MSPVSENDLRVESEPGFSWQSLRDLALSVLVVAAIALIVSFLASTSVHAEAPTERRAAGDQAHGGASQ